MHNAESSIYGVRLFNYRRYKRTYRELGFKSYSSCSTTVTTMNILILYFGKLLLGRRRHINAGII